MVADLPTMRAYVTALWLLKLNVGSRCLKTSETGKVKLNIDQCLFIVMVSVPLVFGATLLWCSLNS